MNLTTIIEWCIQIILPIEFLSFSIPISDAIITMFQIRSVLITKFSLTTRAVVHLIVGRSICIPMVLVFVSACTFVTVTALIEHVTFGILQSIPIVAGTVCQRQLVATFVHFPCIFKSNLSQLFFVAIAVTAIKQIINQQFVAFHAMFIILHVTTAFVLGYTTLSFHQQVMTVLGIFPTDATDVRHYITMTSTICIRSRYIIVYNGSLALAEITLTFVF